jgi:hypothetical protein
VGCRDDNGDGDDDDDDDDDDDGSRWGDEEKILSLERGSGFRRR